MGSDAYYVCDKCATKLLLNHKQPDMGGFCGEYLQKYCPITQEVIRIALPSAFNNEERITCLLDIAEPPEMPKIRAYYSKYSWLESMIQWIKKRFFIWKCAKRKCNGSCLEELHILKKNIISKEAEQYKCPRHGCDGIMHIEPPGIYSNWD